MLPLLAVGVMLATGCQAPAVVPIDDAPAMRHPAKGRSLSFSPYEATSPRQHAAWYDHRNDHGLAAFAGYDYPEEEFITKREYHRVHVSNGRVHDRSHGYTLRESYKATVRY